MVAKNPFIQRRLDDWFISDTYQEEVHKMIISLLQLTLTTLQSLFASTTVERQKHGSSIVLEIQR